MAAILKMPTYYAQVQFDMKRSSQIMQEKVFLVVMTSSMTSQGDLKVAPLYSLVNEK